MTHPAQLVVLVTVLLSACAGSAGRSSSPTSGSSPAARAAGGGAPKGELLLTSGTVGPFLSRGPDSNVTLWARPSNPGAGWWSVALDRSGSPIGSSKRIAPAPGRVDLVRLSSTKDSKALALASGRDARGGALWALCLGTRGELKGGPHRVADLPNGAVWLDSVRTKDGSIAIWAERGDSHAQILAVVLDSLGRPRSEVARLHDAATAWQVQEVPGGAVLAVVNASGEAEILNVDGSAEVTKIRTLENISAAGSDLDLARVGEELLLAFSHPEPLQHHLRQVRLSLDGQLQSAARFLVPPKGEQRLLRLVSGSPGYAVWTEKDFGDEILAGRIGANGSVEGSPLSLPPSGKGLPEFAASPLGLNVLYWSCPVKVGCKEPLLPTLLRSDRDGRVTQLSGWLNRSGGTPDLAWDLRCEGDDCKALSATFSEPASVQLQGHNDGHWALPAQGERRGPKASRALIETEKLAGLQVAAFEDGHLVTWLTDFDPETPYVRPKTPAPDGRLAPVRAKLISQWLPNHATSAPASQVLSYRARSIAGITLTPRGPQSLLGWTAIDGNEPQIFTTLLDKQGTKMRQRMLTRQRGEPSNLSSARLTNGWVVSWCNTVNSRTDAYIAKIGPDLGRISRDTPLGESADVRSAEAWGQVWTLRTASSGELLLGALNAQTFKPSRDEVPLSKGAVISHPRLILSGEQLVAAWTSGPSKPKLHWLRINESGTPDGEAKSAVLPAPALELDISCTESRCIAAFTSQSNQLEQLVLDGQSKPTLVAHTSTRGLAVPTDGDVWFHAPLGAHHFAIHQASIGE